ncbi:3-hydroxylacyl-ACP dehydratase [Uliginosibacterium sp. H3]|uniref:3-hydroxylacyl-ACP dehydratase n=1 Tax=Uliginosibacterium silvisoli TaxID=3114758 RepID=A0ABU6JXS8_9RHOO|nr:3-hydroxylacyl-ACP dehydratase [Uliginosibacterium sp. H3]
MSLSASTMLDRQQIAARIPHTADMCLLDSVEHWDADGIRCHSQSHSNSDNPLREAGQLGAACGVEYAAQAMAIHGALLAGLSDDTRPRAGFLASMRDVQLHVMTLDDIVGTLRVEASRLTGDGQSILYSFKVSAGDTALVTGRAAVVLDASKIEAKQAQQAMEQK